LKHTVHNRWIYKQNLRDFQYLQQPLKIFWRP